MSLWNPRAVVDKQDLNSIGIRASFCLDMKYPALRHSFNGVRDDVAKHLHQFASAREQGEVVLKLTFSEDASRFEFTILGMLETNYDAGMARQTWSEIESLATERHHYLLASRAVGEEGIAAFLLGDMATARKNVEKAWVVAKFADPAAHIRYASMYGTGLVELHKYKEAIGPLDEAIRVAAKTHHVAYPSIAINAKIDALSGTGRNDHALALAADAMHKFAALHLAGHLYELHQNRARVYERMNNWKRHLP